MTSEDTIKAAALYLLKNGLASQAEVTRLSGRSRQIVAHWARDYPAARAIRLDKIWQKALQTRKK